MKRQGTNPTSAPLEPHEMTNIMTADVADPSLDDGLEPD